MAGVLIVKDARLFLIQAIDYGIERKILTEQFYDELEKKAADLAFGFAKRYYQIVYEAYLRQAFFNVLGILNLGLLFISDSNLEKAALLFKEKEVVHVFRHGWTMLTKLAQRRYALDSFNGVLLSIGPHLGINSLAETEKKHAEIYCAIPGRKWTGDKDYKKEIRECTEEEEKKEFHAWLVRNYSENSACHAYDVLTCFLSLLLPEQPHIPLQSEAEIDLLVETLIGKDLDDVEAILSAFQVQVPEHLQKAFLDKLAEYLKFEILSYLGELNIQGKQALKNRLAKELFVKIDYDQAN